jgi:hypothetical protein
MGAHALGAAAYAVIAAGLAAPNRPQVVGDEIRWQLTHMTPGVRAALRALPPVGQNASGPLGPGLLASGELGKIIQELQVGLAEGTTHRPPGTHAISATWGEPPPAVDVIAFSSLNLKIPATGQDDYQGRSHSLWYCDAQRKGEFHWYETAFMPHPMKQFVAYQEPFALNPNSDSGAAIKPGGSYNAQVAWPFTELDVGDLNEFISRWAGWLAEASQSQLRRPPHMPERNVQGSWRVA